MSPRFSWYRCSAALPAIPRPIVCLLAWVFAEDRHLNKYAVLLARYGYDTLIVRTAAASMWIPAWAAANARAVLAELAAELTCSGERPLVFYCFSGAAKSVYAPLLEYLGGAAGRPLQAGAQYAIVRRCCVGQVFDSCPVDFTSERGRELLVPRSVAAAERTGTGALAGAVAAGVVDAVAAALDFTALEVFEADRERMWTALRHPPLRGPVLFLYSRGDTLADATQVAGLAAALRAKGHSVIEQVWEDSPHVSHMMAHTQQYEECLGYLVHATLAEWAYRRPAVASEPRMGLEQGDVMAVGTEERRPPGARSEPALEASQLQLQCTEASRGPRPGTLCHQHPQLPRQAASPAHAREAAPPAAAALAAGAAAPGAPHCSSRALRLALDRGADAVAPADGGLCLAPARGMEPQAAQHALRCVVELPLAPSVAQQLPADTAASVVSLVEMRKRLEGSAGGAGQATDPGRSGSAAAGCGGAGEQCAGCGTGGGAAGGAGGNGPQRRSPPCHCHSADGCAACARHAGAAGRQVLCSEDASLAHTIRCLHRGALVRHLTHSSGLVPEAAAVDCTRNQLSSLALSLPAEQHGARGAGPAFKEGAPVGKDTGGVGALRLLGQQLGKRLKLRSKL